MGSHPTRQQRRREERQLREQLGEAGIVVPQEASRMELRELVQQTVQVSTGLRVLTIR